MKAMIGFTKGLMSMPMPWPVWLGLLVAVNVAGPIYFFEALEAKVVLASFLASAALMTAIFASKGFVRVLGIGHIFWIPMGPWLWTRIDQVEPGKGIVTLIGFTAKLRLLADGRHVHFQSLSRTEECQIRPILD